jgi:hypothetical protein
VGFLSACCKKSLTAEKKGEGGEGRERFMSENEIKEKNENLQ